MSNVINLADRKNQKVAKQTIADHDDRLQRIRSSLEKINILLAALNEQAEKGKNK
tara:strand:- start:1616 stop:1780 length:165 start_codon:yes stop_codon:yes gene_type:complete